MATVMNFHEKYRHKQLDFERKALQELSIQKIETAINNVFEDFIKPVAAYWQTISDMCLDYAIESFLLGASYGRFGYYGEPVERVYSRSQSRFKTLLDDFYDFWLFWYYVDNMANESIYLACEAYLYHWWKEGFESAVRRYRMRLH
ncbi:uncharacterized protein DUF2521 [Scopulibacillus darangshiensis]|uniref:Uncharacterized protein DUF2521 n=1 Tax=Scopulibacillus darangshiensis TaxID=442528 RepID=A0A4R2NQY8_9BACL|nr:DUF2521 family protein [Scopulibacillus darangshiensis]TCP24197.1 uncharacterized protein DUF2521 [Scopulibacillus darangshiensis]